MVIQESITERKKYVSKIRSLFCQIDTDNSDRITVTELGKFLEDEMAGAYFEYLELDVSDSSEIFSLLDTDLTGEICLTEFVDGCTRLRGTASALLVAQTEHEAKLRHGEIMRKLLHMEEGLRLANHSVWDSIGHRAGTV